MRLIFLLLVLGGIGASFVYPWVVTNFSGHEIGTWRVYERGQAFQPVVARLAAADAPVRVMVDMIAVAPPEFAQSSTVLTLTASTGGRTVLAEPLSFAEAKPQEKSPQTARESLPRRGRRHLQCSGRRLHLRRRTGRCGRDPDQVRRSRPARRRGVGRCEGAAARLAAIAIGFIGLVLAMRRGRRDRKPDAPPAPRWGRGGDQPPA